MNLPYVTRDIEPLLARLLDQFPAVALTGPRQAGKTTLVQHCLPHYRYLTLDDPLLHEQAAADPNRFLDGVGDRAVIDEVQYAPDLLRYVKMRIDQERHVRGRFVITGSQQFTLMRGLSESLAGRVALLELLPFSVVEKLRCPDAASRLGTAEDWFVDACLRSSYPEPALLPDLDLPLWWAAYVRTYLERDVRTTYDIGSLRDFQRCTQLLAARCGQVLNMSTVASDIGVSVPTIRRWVSVLEACRIVFLLPAYYRNLGKRIVKSPKVYFTDCGLVCYLAGIRSPEALLNGPLAGPLFENFCVQEALKLYMANGLPPRLYHLRTRSQLEVDLIVEGLDHRPQGFELKLSKTPRPAMATGLRRFAGLSPDPQPHPGRLVSLSEQTVPLTGGIAAVPVGTFLDDVRRLLA